ncbi:26108_t:CDS:2, partial [Dentiscutata erythropus]
MSQTSRPKAYELPCIFNRLVSRYDKIGLSACKTSASQTWRHANSQAAARRLPLFQAFMPELTDLQSSLKLERTEDPLRSQANSEDVDNFANIITELLVQIETKNVKIVELKKRIGKYCEEIIKLEDLYQKQCKVNEELVKQWNSRHSDRDKHIQEVINIVQLEREYLYKDI